MPTDLKRFFILHEGIIQMADGTLNEITYSDAAELDVVEREGTHAEVTEVAANGWIGITDHYWMTTLMPAPGQPFTAVAKYVANADIFQTEARLPPVSVAPGATASATTYLFAGAKEWATIRAYQNVNGFERFLDSIDWGWFYFLTKPMFAVLHWLNAQIGNMGWSIIALTFLLKALLFPLAYKSYVSMAKMKELQPEMEKIKERAGDDRMKMQQEMMALYKKEKVNPASGCLPILLQIPIFFSLYKVIFVTIELRHAPWFGPFQDLSAPDPTSIINLLGPPALRQPRTGVDPRADLHRDPAAAPRHLDVAPAEAEPGADRCDPGDDLRLDAVDLHVHAGRLRERARDLLDREQHHHLRAAVHDHADARATSPTSSATSCRASSASPRRPRRRRPRPGRASLRPRSDGDGSPTSSGTR